MASVEIMRRDCSVAQLRAEAASTADAKQARSAFWRLQWCWTGMRGFWRHRPAAWTGRRCATGLFAITRVGWPGWPTGHGLAARPLYRTGNGPRWRSGFKAALTARQTGWRAGAVPICVTASPRTLASACMSAVSASCCTRLISAASRAPPRSAKRPRGAGDF